MATPVLDQNRAYRKGVILGFTMAEISILIIFCLLLATSFLIQEKNDVISKVSHENNELNQVKSKLDELRQNSTSQMEFDDLFQELTHSKAQKEKMKQLQADLDKRLQGLKELEAVTSKLQSNNADKPIEEIFSELVTDAQYTKEIKNNLKNPSQKNLSGEQIAQTINSVGKLTEVVAEKMNALVEVERLKGQLANSQTKLERLGKGTEMPACWADAKTGKPEYIFKIDLTSNGLIIHDQHLQNRINDQKLLPANMIHFDKSLSPRDFLAQTRPLAQWSIQHNCRFFVKAKDETPANQKNTYKAMLRTLESHFYKLEQ